LAYELGNTLDELDAFKRTVVDSKSLISKEYISTDNADGEENNFMMPSFLRVMQAEQTLVDNYVYESEPGKATKGGQQIIREESFEAENENSIPQESSIAANVSFQN